MGGSTPPTSNQEAVCLLHLLAKGKMLSPTRCHRHIKHTAVQAKCIGVVGECKTNHAFLRTFCLVLAFFILLVCEDSGVCFCLFVSESEEGNIKLRGHAGREENMIKLYLLD